MRWRHVSRMRSPTAPALTRSLERINWGVVETPPVTVAGASPGAAYQLPEANPLLKPAFDLSPDDDPVVETLTAGQRYALLAVRRIVDAEPPPLAGVQLRVKADMLRERAAARAKAITDQLVARINAGVPMRQAFAKAGVPLPAVQSASMRRMEVNNAGDRAPPPLRLMFTLPKGKARPAAAAPNGAGWFVVVVELITPGKLDQAQQLVDETRKELGSRLPDEYAAQFAAAVERDVGKFQAQRRRHRPLQAPARNRRHRGVTGQQGRIGPSL